MNNRRNRHSTFLGWTQHRLKRIEQPKSRSFWQKLQKKVKKKLSIISMSIFFIVFVLILIFGSLIPSIKTPQTKTDVSVVNP